MPTVVIIHAAEDTLPARALAEKLRQAQLTVILEQPPGEEQRAALKGAPVTIALWSPRSVAQPALIDDAAFARGKSKVFHALMQSAQTPEAFRGDQSVNLTGWRGEDNFGPWRDLANLITKAAGVAPLSAAPPRAQSGFFQPGRTPAPAGAATAAAQQTRSQPAPRAPQPQAASRPAPQAPRPAPAPRAPSGPAYDSDEPKKGGGMAMFAIIGVIALAAVGGGGYWFMSQQSAQTTSASWDDVERNDPAALRAFLEGSPGEYRAEAQAALAELEERTYEAASDADTIEAFEGFLNEFPDSEHTIAARGRIAELRTMTPAEPIEGVDPATLPEIPPATDPDLVPPGTITMPPPATTGGPATIAPPPAEEAPPPEPGAEEPPTN